MTQQGGSAGARDWPADALESVASCPVCGSDRRRRLYDGLTDRISFSADGRWTLYGCSKCSAAYLDPRPDRGSIGDAYADYYAGGGTPSPPALVGAGIRNAICNGYLNSRYGYELSPASRVGPIVARVLPKRRSYADRAVRHLPRLEGRRRLLDVGCGEGAFLAEMRRAGWEVQGLEPDPTAAATARSSGVPVVEQPLEAAAFASGSFDAITMNHVIEHLHDPIEALRICYDVLRPGGVLWIATPNLSSRGHDLFKRDWVGLDPPRHLVLFTRSSLSRAVRSAGFEPQRFVSDYSADRVFPCSATVAAGEDPRDERVVRRHRSRSAILAGDVTARLRPSRAEDIVLIAQRAPT
jgi:SAM-dependent methyltransferase